MKHTMDKILDSYVLDVVRDTERSLSEGVRKQAQIDLLTEALKTQNKRTILWMLQLLLEEHEELTIAAHDIDTAELKEKLKKFDVNVISNSHIVIRKQ